VISGILDITYTGISSLPSDLVIGESLYINQSQISSIPEGCKIGGRVVIIHDHNLPTLSDVKYNKLIDGDHVVNRYIYADGILTLIKREMNAGRYTFCIGLFPDYNAIYDGTYYAQCIGLKSGIQDLAFKHANDRGSDQYKSLTRDSVVSKEDAIVMYRVITGACQQGTNMFIDSLKEVKDSYTIQEIIDLTRGQYRSDVFEKFFA
jgi:hypothetical protein